MHSLATPFARALVACALGATHLMAAAAPTPIGSPQIYAKVSHHGVGFGSLAPDPAAELFDPGTIVSRSDDGSQLALVSAQRFGLYGADVAFPGVGRLGGQTLGGTRALLFYEQQYRVATRGDGFSLNVFNIDMRATDGTGRDTAEYSALFAIDLWITLFDPLGPDFDSADPPDDSRWYGRVPACGAAPTTGRPSR
jgi:hypothetical protein